MYLAVSIKSCIFAAEFLHRDAKKSNFMKKTVFMFVLFQLLFSTLTYGQQNVKASYYADKFHGRKTASGAIYHRDSLTCAHKTLPFGTVLKVKNLRNDKEVIVTVTDRGPFIKGRTIDLSYAAAKEIGMIPHGILTVEMQRIEPSQLTEAKLSALREENSLFAQSLKKLQAPADTLNVRPDNTKVSDQNIRIAYFSKSTIMKIA